MAGSFSSDAGNSTILFQYTATTTKMINVLTATAHALWNMGYGDHTHPNIFDTLTNQQKIDIIDSYVRFSIVDLSKQYTVSVAKDAAIADAQANLTL